MPMMRAAQSWVFSAVQQTTCLLRAAATTKTTRLFSSLPPAVPPSPPMTGSSAKAFGSTALVNKTSAFAPSPAGLSPASSSLLTPCTPSLTQTRGRAEIYYRPSAWKRVNKHGIERRLRTQGGIEVLWRRFLKKRHCLTPFDRILPGTYKGQILPDHHLKYNQDLVSREVRKRVQEVIRKKYSVKR